MNRLCVYCGSSTGTGDAYVAAARELGELLLRQEIGLVYGGSNLGIMGTIADTVLAGGGNVTGIIPHALHGKEIAHTGAVLSDGFIAMPGGFGTLEEIIEVITWGQLGFHDKPCGLLNIGGYFNHLLAFLDHTQAEGFLHVQHRSMLLVANTPAELLTRGA
jgi:predicted Rossmann-fold nucleotide-binding protein